MTTTTQGLVRPSPTFESITFSDGQTLSFEEDDIIVFVGPNNAENLQHSGSFRFGSLGLSANR